ncbi:MAG: hypothetical protein IKM61_05615 [Eubacteriaceae bacterium]|nr:hypothetical protein [Eubacteriaceae bacterium]
MNDDLCGRTLPEIDIKYIREAEDIVLFKSMIKRKRKLTFIVAVTFVILTIIISFFHNENIILKEDPGILNGNYSMFGSGASGVATLGIDAKICDVPKSNPIFKNVTSLIPDEYALSACHSVNTRFISGREYRDYIPHDYVFEFVSVSDDRSFTLSVCPYEKVLTDCIVISDTSYLSTIGDIQVRITRFADNYYAEFENDGMFYDIESKNMSVEDFANIIRLISASGECDE